MIWDWAVQYFVDTPARCLVAGAGCRYLRPDGHRCVIGSMLEPETERDVQFLMSFFGSVSDMLDLHHTCTPGYGLRNVDWLTESSERLLGEIQVIHDQRRFWNEPFGLNDFGWFEMKHTAMSNGLSTQYLEDVRSGRN